MEITTFALILSIAGLIASLFFAGGLISLVSLVMCIRLFLEEKSIRVVRALAISAVGVVLPVIMYFNTYGLGLPKTFNPVTVVKEVVVTNYTQLGILKGDGGSGYENGYVDGTGQGIVVESPESSAVGTSEDEMVYVSNMPSDNGDGEDAADSGEASESDKDFIESDTIFESLDSIDPSEKPKGGIISVAPSDDDMPSYGGMPLGVLLVAQYFREDDHNCNPVLVLKNSTGEACRFECRFTARDAEGNEMAFSDKTVEVVRDGSVFVFEGRFDKKDLGGGVPDAFEFLITKRSPYEQDMADQVSVFTRVMDNSAILTAENESDKKVKVDAYVLFFDGTELVDCMWMIPQNTDEVCLEPGTMASIRGDAYYRFDRVETYYTAYEAK